MSRFWFATKSFWTNYGNFSGRTHRANYWLAVLSIGLSGLLANLIDIFALPSIGIGQSVFLGLGVVSTVFAFVTFVPGLALSWRRLLDAGQSGWWAIAPVLLGASSVAISSLTPAPAWFSILEIFLAAMAAATLVTFVVFTLRPSRYGRQNSRNAVLVSSSFGIAMTVIAAAWSPATLNFTFPEVDPSGWFGSNSEGDPTLTGSESDFNGDDFLRFRTPGANYECAAPSGGSRTDWSITGAALVPQISPFLGTASFTIAGVTVGSVYAGPDLNAFVLGLRFFNTTSDMLTLDFAQSYFDGWEIQGSDLFLYPVESFRFGYGGPCVGMILPGESQSGFIWAPIPPDLESVTVRHVSGFSQTYVLSDVTQGDLETWSGSLDTGLPGVGDTISHDGVSVTLNSVTYSEPNYESDGVCVPGERGVSLDCSGMFELVVENATMQDLYVAGLFYFPEGGYDFLQFPVSSGEYDDTVQEGNIGGVSVPAGSTRRFAMEQFVVKSGELRVLVTTNSGGIPLGGSYTLVGTFGFPS